MNKTVKYRKKTGQVFFSLLLLIKQTHPEAHCIKLPQQAPSLFCSCLGHVLSALCFVQASVVRAFPGTSQPTNPEKGSKYFSGHSSAVESVHWRVCVKSKRHIKSTIPPLRRCLRNRSLTQNSDLKHFQHAPCFSICINWTVS